MEKCENCGNGIGKLEVPQLWNNSVVCGRCRKILEAQVTEKRAVAHQAVASEERRRVIRRNRIITTLFFVVIVGVVGFIVTRPHIADADQVFYLVVAIIPIIAYMAWVPVMIVQNKGRSDKAIAVGALSFFGILTLGFVWIAALIWALGLKEESSVAI